MSIKPGKQRPGLSLAMGPLIGYDSEGFRAIGVFFSVRFDEVLLGKLRESDIAFHVAMDHGQNHGGCNRQALSENLRPADDKDFLGCLAHIDGGTERLGIFTAPGSILSVAAQNDVASAGQRAGERFEGLPAHDQGVSHCRLFEELEFLRNVPRHFAFSANDPISGNGGNNNYFHGTNLLEITEKYIVFALSCI
jgi:hypothetical protein